MWKSTVHSRRRIFTLSAQRKGKMNYFPMHISQERLSYTAVKKKISGTYSNERLLLIHAACLLWVGHYITFAKSDRQAEGNSIWGWPASVAWGRGFGKLYTCA